MIMPTIQKTSLGSDVKSTVGVVREKNEGISGMNRKPVKRQAYKSREASSTV